MNKGCSDCRNYNRGDGRPSCLKCDKFKYLLPRSRSVKLLPSPPDIIIDNIVDNSAQPTILEALAKALSIEDATLILQYYYLRYTSRELAEHYKISQPMVIKKIKKSIKKTRAYLQKRD